LSSWVRGTLVGIGLGLTVVFAVACWLNPHRQDGSPRRMGTHQLLGLPPCNFYFMTGVPCPACGMTTSFALLMHGDMLGSLRANAVGTGLALVCLAAVPWSLISAWRGRTLFVRSLERTFTLIVLVLLAALLLRWAVVLALGSWRELSAGG
jgi:hypothetical protein